MFGEERNHWIAPEWQREGVSLLLLWIAVTINPRYVGAPLSTCCQGRNNSLVVTVMPMYNRKGVLTVVFLPLGQLSRLSCDLKQEELRQHLKENFDCGILTPFPTTTSGKKNKRKHNNSLIVYALCQLSMTL